MEIHPTYQWRKLTPENGIYLFGYYPNPEEGNTQILELISAADGRRELLGRFRHSTGPGQAQICEARAGKSINYRASPLARLR